MSLAVPSDPWEESYNENYFSKFMRSGVTRIPFAVIDTGRGQDYALNATGFLDLILTGHDHDLFINYDERGTVVELSYDAHRIVVVDVTIAW